MVPTCTGVENPWDGDPIAPSLQSVNGSDSVGGCCMLTAATPGAAASMGLAEGYEMILGSSRRARPR